MTKDRLIELVRRVLEVDGIEEEIKYALRPFRAVPHPGWLDLITTTIKS